jgi:hypothetical protein
MEPSPGSRLHRSRSGGAIRTVSPVDEPPAVRGQHGVAGMRLAVGEHVPCGHRAGRHDKLVVPVQQLPDRRRVLAEQPRQWQRVPPAVRDSAALAARLQFIPERDGELVGQRVPARCRGSQVHRGQHLCHPGPLPRCPLSPGEALSLNERVERDSEPLAKPRRWPASGERQRCQHEAEPRVLQRDRRAERRGEPGEPVVSRLGSRQPLLLKLVDGQEPSRAVRPGDLPVMTAPSHGPVCHGRDADTPPPLERARQRPFVEVPGHREHSATLGRCGNRR